jgi:hypothetical protein
MGLCTAAPEHWHRRHAPPALKIREWIIMPIDYRFDDLDLREEPASSKGMYGRVPTPITCQSEPTVCLTDVCTADCCTDPCTAGC